MSEHALDAAPASLTPPTPASPTAAPPAPPATPGITLDGTAPRLGTNPSPFAAPSARRTTTPIQAPPALPPVTTPAPITSTESTRYSLDGTAPRLASSAPIVAVGSEPLPLVATVQPSAPSPSADPPSLPLVSPVLSSPTTATLPNQTAQTTPPSLHTTASNVAASTADTEAPVTGEPVHPMAHLMPTKQSGPSEASRRAAEQRAISKAKAKKVKIGVISGILVVTAVVGPPLSRWVVDAVNDAGKPSTAVDPVE